MTPAERASLTVRVRSKLRQRPRTLELKRIASDTGLSVGWLKCFSRGQYEKPSLPMVQTLKNYLEGAEQI